MAQSKAIIFEKVYGTLTTEIQKMCSDMLERGVKKVAMESTSTYWAPVWAVLSEHMECALANPYFIKQLPGRKSDVKDAQWIAECVVNGQIRPSFVPGPAVQDMRKYNRRMYDIQQDRTYYSNKLDAALQRCGFRLSNYVSGTGCKSYRECAKAIARGETDPAGLLRLVHGRTVGKHGRETILGAVTGTFTQADIALVKQYLEMLEALDRQHQECLQALLALCREHFPEQFQRLQTIPGVKERAAAAIIAETGGDMAPFEKASKLVAWSGLRPRNDESNKKIKSSKITHGNKFLRWILIEIAWTASRKKDSFFSHFSYVQCVQKRKNKMKVQVAISRKILVAVWHMLSKGEDFNDLYKKRLEEHARIAREMEQMASSMAS